MFSRSFLFVSGLLVCLIPLTTFSQTVPEPTTNPRVIPDLVLESVKGESIQVSKVNTNILIVFLLPRPSSMSKGKEMMEEVRSWARKWSNWNDDIYQFMIVEPFKTSFPFYSIQKAKLKKESFPVVIDQEGKILKQLDVTSGGLKMLIVDKELKIIRSSGGEYTESRYREVAELLEIYLPDRENR